MVDCFEVGKLKNRIIMVCRWQIDFSGLKKGAWGPIGISAEKWLEKDF